MKKLILFHGILLLNLNSEYIHLNPHWNFLFLNQPWDIWMLLLMRYTYWLTYTLDFHDQRLWLTLTSIFTYSLKRHCYLSRDESLQPMEPVEEEKEEIGGPGAEEGTEGAVDSASSDWSKFTSFSMIICMLLGFFVINTCSSSINPLS